MDFFWLIPLLLVLVVALILFFRYGTKRQAAGQSRLDAARESDSRDEGLRS
jgi:hypothetical protein